MTRRDSVPYVLPTLISPGYRGGEPRVPPENHWTLWWHHQQTPQRFEYLPELHSTVLYINYFMYRVPLHWTKRLWFFILEVWVKGGGGGGGQDGSELMGWAKLGKCRQQNFLSSVIICFLLKEIFNKIVHSFRGNFSNVLVPYLVYSRPQSSTNFFVQLNIQILNILIHLRQLST